MALKQAIFHLNSSKLDLKYDLENDFLVISWLKNKNKLLKMRLSKSISKELQKPTIYNS